MFSVKIFLTLLRCKIKMYILANRNNGSWCSQLHFSLFQMCVTICSIYFAVQKWCFYQPSYFVVWLLQYHFIPNTYYTIWNTFSRIILSCFIYLDLYSPLHKLQDSATNRIKGMQKIHKITQSLNYTTSQLVTVN